MVIIWGPYLTMSVICIAHTIDHNILLNRLANLGITGTCYKWLESYLTDRSQSVIITGKQSSPQPLRFSVPQGSVLGSLLFTLYISPLGQIIRHHNLKFHQYADDNQLYLSFTRSNCVDAINSVEICIRDIKDWLTQNKLKLNDSKTEILLIRSRFDTLPAPITSIHIGTSCVTITDSARNIGVTFDDSYSFKPHISNTCRSVNYFLRKMAHIRKFLTEESCKTVIHAVMSAKLDYANSLLYGLPDNQLQLLQRTQNTAARIITRSRKFDHITPILRRLHWLPVSYRINFKIILLTYKALHGLAPRYMRDMLTHRLNTRTLRSSSQQLLYVPRWRLKSFGRRSFAVAGPVLWNQLPLHIKSAPNINIFKNRLKTYVFNCLYVSTSATEHWFPLDIGAL